MRLAVIIFIDDVKPNRIIMEKIRETGKSTWLIGNTEAVLAEEPKSLIGTLINEMIIDGHLCAEPPKRKQGKFFDFKHRPFRLDRK